MLYKTIVELFENLSKTTKRLEKTYLISEAIKKIPIDELEPGMLMVQGKLFPEWDERKIGIAEKILIKAINKSTGFSEEKIIEEWKNKGDLGSVAEILIKEKKQASLFPKQLTLKEVFEKLRGLADKEGKGSIEKKLTIISDMLINATPLEAKYLIRTLADNLRIGIGKSTIRDAIVWAFFSDSFKYDKNLNELDFDEKYKEKIEKIQCAYDLLNDFGKIAFILKNNPEELDNLSLQIGTPLNVMLFQKAKNIEDAFSIVGKPAAFEYKYDGFRLQIHKKGNEIKLFTRNLENVSEQFPEVIDSLKNIKGNFIIDAEAVAYDPKTKKNIPFQLISQRIKRKYNIKEMAEKYPVKLNIFDIMFFENKNLLNTEFKIRHKILEQIFEKDKLAEQIITDSEKEVEKFYEKALSLGYEGIMAKNLNGTYKPGKRIGYGVKIKPIMEPLDLAITAGEYGEGKRQGFLSTFYIACLDSETNEYKEIGKVSTGLKEIEEQGFSFKELTKLLEPLIIKKEGKRVKIKPEIIIEVGYEEIQKSTTYSSGYALRFPRFIRLRQDKNESSTLKEIELLFNQQRGRA